MNEARAESPLLIVFTDLSRFYLQSKRFTDTQMADTVDAYYELVGEGFGPQMVARSSSLVMGAWLSSRRVQWWGLSRCCWG